MNKYLKILGLTFLLCFSFYYTDKIAQFMRSKDPIYASIVASMDSKKLDSVNAVIEKDTIIPGLNGSVVNVEKSFEKMKNQGFYSESKLVYDEVSPDVSLENHLDKTIHKANSYKQGVSLIIDSNTLAYDLDELGTFYAILTNKENVKNVYAYGTKINVDSNYYKEVENILKKQKNSSLFCYVNKLEEDFCKKEKKILIKETLSLSNRNFASTYRNISSGSILFLDHLDLQNVKILLNQLYFQGLKVLPLEELLSESRS